MSYLLSSNDMVMRDKITLVPFTERKKGRRHSHWQKGMCQWQMHRAQCQTLPLVTSTPNNPTAAKAVSHPFLHATFLTNTGLKQKRDFSFNRSIGALLLTFYPPRQRFHHPDALWRAWESLVLTQGQNKPPCWAPGIPARQQPPSLTCLRKTEGSKGSPPPPR